MSIDLQIEAAIDRVLVEALQSSILRKISTSDFSTARTGGGQILSFFQDRTIKINKIAWSEVKDSNFEVLAPQEAVKLVNDSTVRFSKQEYVNGFENQSAPVFREPLIFWYNIDTRPNPQIKGCYKSPSNLNMPSLPEIPKNTLIAVTQGPFFAGFGSSSFDGPGWFVKTHHSLELPVFLKNAHKLCDLAYVLKNPPRTYGLKAQRVKAKRGVLAFMNSELIKKKADERLWQLMADKYTPENIKLFVEKIIRMATTNLIQLVQSDDPDYKEAEDTKRMIEYTWSSYLDAREVERDIADIKGTDEDAEEARWDANRKKREIIRNLRSNWLKVTGKREF